MPKDPAFLFYSSDFITGCADLTMEERGQFITLMCLQHQKGALSEKIIKLQCGGNVSPDVMAKFEQNEDGLFFNSRVKKEKEKRQTYSSYKIAASTLGGLISSHKLNKKQTLKIKNSFQIDDFKHLKREEIKSVISTWFKQQLSKCLTIYENENENENENIDVSVIVNEKNSSINKKPNLEEFVDYGKALLAQLNKNSEEFDFALRSKFHTWNDDGWKNGHGRKIKNWKNTLGNTIPYLKPIYDGNNKTKPKQQYSKDFHREILEGLQSS